MLPAMVLHVAWGSPDSTRTTGWMELRRVGSISKLNFFSCKVTVPTEGLAELNVGALHVMGRKLKVNGVEIRHFRYTPQPRRSFRCPKNLDFPIYSYAPIMS